MSSIIALIPARGGSKGVPGKNIKNLNGRPLIAYTIEASLRAKSISRTIVSTDREEIAQVSLEFGAEVPFMRPSELAEDHILDYPVINHALDYLINIEESRPEIIVYLRPTMPTRSSDEIEEVVSLLLREEQADCVRTTRPVPYSPYWMKKINSDGYLEPYDDHILPFDKKRRQDLPQVVMCDGYVDAARVQSIVRDNNFPPSHKLAYYRDNIPFIDIDTLEDWEYCEYFMKKNNG